ncbi:MAG: group II intron reverse transcriptase/maturase, partial [Flavobacteriales bacterium]
MIEDVINPRNMQQACIQVARNKGSAGVDGMSVNALKDFVRRNRVQIAGALKQGDYRPQPILGVAIPKSNGKTRLLGIPTVADRWLQQCVAQAITPMFEFEFKPHSYGFRPGKNAQHCVLQAQQYINAGYSHIVDIDLKSFFDEVDHCILLQLLYRKVKCRVTLRLIRQWLRAPIMIEGKLVKRRKGVPQGSPLSPLLSNIMLHELDRYLEKRGCKYVRYADDFSIYCKKKSEARMIGNDVFLFLKDKLKLPINREKSGIRRPVHFKLLGYEFVPTYEKGTKGKYQLVVSESGWKVLKEKIRTITRKTAPLSLAERTRQLKEIGRGWVNYFRLASLVGKLGTVDSWVRNRLRYCIWKDWKKPERKRKNLIRLGVDYHHAYAWSRTRKGGWAIAQSPILTTTITLERLAKRG